MLGRRVLAEFGAWCRNRCSGAMVHLRVNLLSAWQSRAARLDPRVVSIWRFESSTSCHLCVLLETTDLGTNLYASSLTDYRYLVAWSPPIKKRFDQVSAMNSINHDESRHNGVVVRQRVRLFKSITPIYLRTSHSTLTAS